jgi:hypothetical protein
MRKPAAAPVEATMQMQLTEAERAALADVLNEVLPSLREEITRTENYDFREQLKQRKALLEQILARLAAVAV